MAAWVGRMRGRIAGFVSAPLTVGLAGMVLILDWASLPDDSLRRSAAARWSVLGRGSGHGRPLPVWFIRRDEGVRAICGALGPDDDPLPVCIFQQPARRVGSWGLTREVRVLEVLDSERVLTPQETLLLPEWTAAAIEREDGYEPEYATAIDMLKTGELRRSRVCVGGYVHNACALSLGAIVVIGGQMSLVRSVRRRRSERWANEGRCTACGFALDGLRDNRCPECGQQRRPWERPRAESEE